MDAGITFRSLDSVAELEACLDLQTEIWGDDPMGCVPPLMLKVMQEVGGIVAGALTHDDELVGMVCGLSGFRQGAPAHWSHMLAVKSGYRDLGLGGRLKWLQRELVLAQGVETIYWTFDPLESRNAHLNFNRLGAECEEYRRDFYLGLSRSRRFADIGTDRMVVAWRLREDRVETLKDGAPAQPEMVEKFAATPVVNTRHEGEVEPRPIQPAVLLAEKRIRIEVPAHIQHLKVTMPQLGARWRGSTRNAFETYLERGYRVDAFYRDGASGRCFFGLSRAKR